MSLNNIPLELRQIPNWVCWKTELTEDERATKIPYDPKTGFKASPTNPEHWGTFEQAVAVKHHCDGLGFVLTNDCGYCCIDLDATEDPNEVALQTKIAEHFQSYSEISPSGRGLHIWIKAKLSSGRRRGKVEIYSNARYMTFTGNVYKNLPIKDYQLDAYQLWKEMEVKEKVVSYIDKPQVNTDYEILEMAWKASNGEKFVDLFEGRWQDYYNDDPSKISCNEADFALVNIIAHYTQNREQIVRIFRNSALGKRDKAKRDKYISYMLDRAFDNIPPELDLSELRKNLEGQLSAKQAAQASYDKNPYPAISCGQINAPANSQCAEFSEKPVSNPGNLQIEPVNEEIPIEAVKEALPAVAVKEQSLYSLPPGLMGEIAKFIYESAPRPVHEIALAGAIGLMAGVCGRAYNISGTGLNTYTFLLAKTGRGKEAMRKGINKLIGCATKTVTDATKFMGPAKIASPEALIKYMAKGSNSFVSVMGEFADTLKKMANDSRNPQQQGVRIAMLDLYNQSGKGDVLGSLIYSDKDKNTQAFGSPAFSVLGEATPEKFYELLSKEMITEGLLPRCTIIEYDGKRTQLNDNHSNVKPSQYLEEQFSALCAYSLQLNNGNNVLQVTIDSEAKATLDKFNSYCDNKINNGNEIATELWNRGHMKALKIAGLLAVGCNFYSPVVNVDHAQWAINIVNNEIKKLSGRFNSGNIGVENAQNEQVIDIKKAIKKYVESEFDKIASYPGTNRKLWEKRIIPYSFIAAVCRYKNSFKQDRIGPVQAVKNCLQHLIDCNDIQELSIQNKRQENLPLNAKLYMISGMKV